MVAVVVGSGLGLVNASANVLGDKGAVGLAVAGQNPESIAVNAANGNLVVQVRDELVVGRGMDVATLRTYNSQGGWDGDNSDQWRLSNVRRVTLAGTRNAVGSTLTLTEADGAQTIFAWNATANRYASTEGAGAYDSIVWVATASTWTCTDGSTRTIDRYNGTTGLLASSSDTDGNLITYGYTGTLLTSVTTANHTGTQSNATYYDYVGTNLSKVRTVSWSGTANVTQTRVRYAYDSSNRLSSVTVDLTPGDNAVSDGKTYVTTYTYDGSSKRIASIAQSDGTALAFTY